MRKEPRPPCKGWMSVREETLRGEVQAGLGGAPQTAARRDHSPRSPRCPGRRFRQWINGSSPATLGSPPHVSNYAGRCRGLGRRRPTPAVSLRPAGQTRAPHGSVGCTRLPPGGRATLEWGWPLPPSTAQSFFLLHFVSVMPSVWNRTG